MRRMAALTTSLLVTAMAAGQASRPGVGDAPSPVTAPTKVAATGATDAPLAPIREVTIDPNAKAPVCRRYVPTGSRIATKVCEPPRDSLTAAEQTDRDTLRRDFAEMRELQTLRRTQAQAEAMRRAQRQ